MTTTRAPGTHDLTTRRVKLSTLRPHPRNARNGDVEAVAESLTVNGQYRPIVVTTDGTILAGNHTYAAALSLGWDRISVVTVDVAPESPEALRIMLADNRTADLGGYDDALLLELLRDLDSLDGSGYVEDDVAELELLTATQAGADLDLTGGSSLASRFLIPPFTILDARQGWWQDRKRAWIALGIKSEEGRAGSIDTYGTGGQDGAFAEATRAKMGQEKRQPTAIMMGTRATVIENRDKGGKRTLGQGLTAHRGPDGTLVYEEMPGTAYVSIFDPVLCELTYRWFCPPGGAVLDPYAGGSVRGIVAGRLGLTYTGVELRPEQVEANVEQARVLLPDTPALPALDPDAGTTDDPTALTPVQRWGDYWVKRDDLFVVGGSRGGKVRTCLALAAAAADTPGLVTAGSRHSPQVNIVAGVAAHLGIGARVHVPEGPATAELIAAEAAGADVHRHQAGRNTVIVARAREDAKAQGWLNIPFGMECAEAVTQTGTQVRDLPADVARIVVPVGSGMSLAEILSALDPTIPVLGVVVGADPTARLDKYAPGWQDRVTLVHSGSDYADPAPVTDLHGLPLDPHYEAKCLPHLRAGDLLWVVGRRETAGPAAVSPWALLFSLVLMGALALFVKVAMWLIGWVTS